MEITTVYKDKIASIVEMFGDTFTASEGQEEGQIIAALVAEMLASLSPEDLRVFTALDDTGVRAGILFSRMTYPQDPRTVFILSPVAVSPGQQGKGLGQRLIGHGLQAMGENGCDIVLTYGDIRFYSKVGFRIITEEDAKAPLPLSYPDGWLGQPLGRARFEPLIGPAHCVGPLNDPNLW